MYFTYILFSGKTNSFYKGQTNDLKERLRRHNSGHEKSTKSGCPWLLLWSTKKNTRANAIKLEAKLKNLTKQKLIDFMLKFAEGFEGPDELLLVQQMSGY
ncbi:MAG: GIY-YIG nuclease family protein [Bacteroidota bacterium]